LSLSGESVRDFAPGAAEQVIVRLSVPSGSPAGSYSFRLYAGSDTAPDEDFTEGPSVAFDVAASEPKKRFSWWVVIVPVVVLIGVGGRRALRAFRPRG
jgi:hypothetical protein